MGAYLSAPITDKVSSDESNEYLACGSSSMQGWRMTQEDAHNCIIDYDDKTSFFAVYDGHGGAEVAFYCSKKLPEFLKATKTYKEGNLEEALKESFIGVDATLLDEEVINELRVEENEKNTKGDEETEYDDDELTELCLESKMPLKEVLQKYNNGSYVMPPALENLKKEGNCSKPISPYLRGRRGERTADASTTASSSSSSSASASATVSSGSSSAGLDLSKTSPEVVNSDSTVSSSCSKLNKDKEEPPSASTSTSTTPATNAVVDEKESATNEPSSSSTAETDICSTNGPEEVTASSPDSSSQNKNEDIAIEKPGSSTDNIDLATKVDKDDDKVTQNGCINQSAVVDSVKAIIKEKDSAENEITNSSPTTTQSKSDVSSSSTSQQQPENGDHEENKSEKRKSSTYFNNYSRDSSSSDDDDDDDDEDMNYEDESDSEEGSDFENTPDDEEYECDEFGFVDKNSENYQNDSEKDREFIENMVEEPGKDSGCTAVVAVLHDHELYVANAGDSRCVVCRNGDALDMSIDHKPEDENEIKRIVKAGGRISGDGRVNGGLNLSRAIGDHAYKLNKDLPPEEQMISALPDIKKITLTPEDEFMVLACDGIWNCFSSAEVIQFIKVRLDKGEENISHICEELFDHCLASNTMGDGTGCDNMTAVIIKFKKTFSTATNNTSIIDDTKNARKRAAASPLKTNEDEQTKKQKTDAELPTPSIIDTSSEA